MNDWRIVGDRVVPQWYGGHVGPEGRAAVWFGCRGSARPTGALRAGVPAQRRARMVPRASWRQYQVAPFGSYQMPARGTSIIAMQVIASSRARAGQPSRVGVATALLVGTALVGTSLALLYLVFGENVVDRFMPTG